MATHTTGSVIANSRTPYSVVLDIANPDNGVDNPLGTITRAQFMTQLLAGPLKELISRTANLGTLNFAVDAAKSDYVRITRIEGGLNATLTAPFTVTLHFVADALEFSLYNGAEGQASRLLVELRMIHSTDR